MKRTLIVVPMKHPGLAKTRLSNAMNQSDRRHLVRSLYGNTLNVLQPIRTITGADLAVVTSSDEASDMALHAKVSVIEEPECCGLSEAVAHAAQWAVLRGYERLCVLPADLAAPSRNDLLRLLRSDADVTVCPAADRGTNGLMVSPPDAITFRYGPQSAIRHLEEAESAGLSGVLMPLESLRLDVDTEGCLRRAMQENPNLLEVMG